MKPQLFLIRGLPGSGKSTFADSLVYVASEWKHLEADMFFLDEDDNYNFDASRIKEAHKWCQRETDYHLQQDYNVIVSNTFTTKWEMEPYFEIAKKYGITPVVILCQNDFGSIHKVPKETIEKMKARFEYDISDLFNGE